MQGLKNEIEKLRGDLEDAKKNKGRDEDMQEDTQAKEEKRKERQKS